MRDRDAQAREDALARHQLAELAGVNYRTVLRIESGQDSVQPRTLRKLAAALGVEPRELRKGR
jgi:transcriptional regulator with XRE-family HTH domain